MHLILAANTNELSYTFGGQLDFWYGPGLIVLGRNAQDFAEAQASQLLGSVSLRIYAATARAAAALLSVPQFEQATDVTNEKICLWWSPKGVGAELNVALLVGPEKFATLHEWLRIHQTHKMEVLVELEVAGPSATDAKISPSDFSNGKALVQDHSLGFAFASQDGAGEREEDVKSE